MNLREEQAAMRARQKVVAKTADQKPQEKKAPVKKNAGSEANK
jgi:hypothetical protein